MITKPEGVNILGVPYRIIYVDNPVDVDRDKREALWGSIDHWERVIRIYDKGRVPEDTWQTLIHEVIHGIASALNLEALNSDHEIVDFLALALTDVLIRNAWLEVGG